MTDTQDSILQLNFNQMLPKSINDKILSQIDQNKEGKINGGGNTKVKKERGEISSRTKRLSTTIIETTHTGI
jgi:hypothetical protein